MSLSRNTGVKDNHFAGLGKVVERDDSGLAAQLRSALKALAEYAVETSTTAAMTDNSGATAGHTVVFDATGGTYEDMATITNGHGMKSGDGPFQIVGTPPTGLSLATDYYCIRKSDSIFQVASSASNGKDGVPVTFSTDGASCRIEALCVAPALALSVNAGSVLGSTAASVNTAADSHMTAIATIVERANVFLALIGAGTVNDGPGTGGSGTIAAVVVATSANTTDANCADAGSVGLVFGDLFDAYQTAAEAVSVCRRAVGLNAVPVGRYVAGTVEAGLDVNQGLAISDAVNVALTASSNSPTKVSIDARLVWLADQIALFAEQLDDVGAVTLTTVDHYKA